MKRFFQILISVVILGFLGWGLYNLHIQNKDLQKEIESLSEELEEVESENREIEERIQYFSNTENLIKELKSQFNYTQDGEELMIIVPGQ